MDGLLVQGSKQRFQESFQRRKYIKDNFSSKHPGSNPKSPSLAAIIGEKTKIIDSGPNTAPRKLAPVQNPMSGKGLKTINVVGVSGGGGS